ncbi:hypothetical protein D3C75_593050 [compost metagenome]
MVHEGHRVAGFRLQPLDHVADLVGGAGGARGQGADLPRHHGEATAMGAGPRRLDGGVQRQQIGLDGDLADQFDNVANLPHAAVQRLHAAGRTIDHIADRLGVLTGAADHRVHGVLHVLGGHRRLLDLAELLLHQLQHAAHRLGHRGRGAARLVVVHQHLRIGLPDAVRGADHLADDAVEVVDEAVDPAPHVAGLVVRQAAAVQALAQVAATLGNGADHPGHLAHAPGQPAWAEGGKQQAEQHQQAQAEQVQHAMLQPAVVLQG